MSPVYLREIIRSFCRTVIKVTPICSPSIWARRCFDASMTPPDPELSTKAQPSQRRRQFYLDVFDNKVAIVNTLNQMTSYEFNDLNQQTLQKDPPVLAVEADGLEIPNFQGVTYTRRNVDGIEIGSLDPPTTAKALCAMNRIGW